MFLVGARFSHILFLFAIGLPFLIIFLESKRYVLNRFAILDPYSDPFGKGYHLIQSFKAFQKGGFFGVGPGNSTQKNLILPESHTDFIFSIMGEEVGFIGCLFFILLLFYFLYRGFRLASLQEDQRRYLFIALSFFLISFESILHIFVTLGLVPTTGLPLPFISYGKTFMVVHLSIMGLVLNNTKQKNKFFKTR